MGFSSDRDKKIKKLEHQAELRKKRSAVPQDNYGDRYVTGMEKLRTQGKGDDYRDIPGWYSDDVKERLDKIYGKKEQKKKTK